MRTRPVRSATLALLLLVAACGSDGDVRVSGAPADADDPTSNTEPATPGPAPITLLTHDSFSISDATLAAFTDETGIEVKILRGGDAGAMVNQAILTKGRPQADVLFGIDNSFLSRALDEDLFVAHEAAGLDLVDPTLVLDDEHRVTPIDTGDVCLNYDKAGLAQAGIEPPETLADLVKPDFAGRLVVENPATSSPGLAFLFATIAEFGDGGWQAYWRQLRVNEVEVAEGWESAYYGSFSGSAGSVGDREIVVSYASSPPAEVIFAEEPLEEAPTGVVVDSCYRQIEFAGILAGTEHEDEAGALIDFMLTETFQVDLPLNMFVYPVIDVDLPEAFVLFGAVPEDPYLLDAARVAENRDDWIREWSEIVLR